MSLWSLAPSPLLLGMNLPENDAWTLSLLNNDEVLAVNQDELCRPAARVWQKGGLEVWMRDLAGDAKAVGIFTRGEQAAARVKPSPRSRPTISRTIWSSPTPPVSCVAATRPSRSTVMRSEMRRISSMRCEM